MHRGLVVFALLLLTGLGLWTMRDRMTHHPDDVHKTAKKAKKTLKAKVEEG